METAIFTTINTVSSFFLLQDKELAEARFDLSDHRDVGKVYLGRVSEIVRNLGAAFVEYKKGVKGFLPLTDAEIRSLSCEQVIPVQISKEAVKTKNAVLTTRPCLTGLYSVVTMDGGGQIRVSKKIGKEAAEHLKEIIKDVDLRGYSVAIRTNANALLTGEPVSAISIDENGRDLLLTELNHLLDLAGQIERCAGNRVQYSLLYQPSFTVQMLSKTSLTKLDKIVTDSVNIYDECKNILPGAYFDKVLSLYEDPSFSLIALYELKAKVSEAVSRKVWLKSGGYLIFDATETLSAIDVNSGKDQSKITKQELIHKTNKEAAIKIATQLRARNMSGMILIDFMNSDQAEINSLMNRMRALTLSDPGKTVIVDMTGLWLMELTRKKDGPSLIDQLKEAGLYETFVL